jgi:hypothetical protein
LIVIKTPLSLTDAKDGKSADDLVALLSRARTERSSSKEWNEAHPNDPVA